MGLGNGGPDAGSRLAVSLAEQFVGLRSEFLSAPEVLWSGHRCSIRLAVLYWRDYRAGSLANSATSVIANATPHDQRQRHRPLPLARYDQPGRATAPAAQFLGYLVASTASSTPSRTWADSHPSA